MRILAGPLNYQDHGAIIGDLAGFDVRCFAERDADVLYHPAQDSFQDLWGRLPGNWVPDVVAWWWPEYTVIPRGIEECPCLSVAIVGDWNLNFLATRPLLDAFDHVFTDLKGVELLRQSGFDRVTRWPVYGFDPRQFRRLPDTERIYDVTFVGNFNPQVQRERTAWLKRLTSLSHRFHIRLFHGVYGDDYTRVLNQSKIVFNRSIRLEMNLRAYEAAACGALLFMEEENLEVRDYFVDRIHCVLYNGENLERLVAHYIEHPEEREAIALRGWERVQAETFRKHFERLVDLVECYSRARRAPRAFTALPPARKAFLRGMKASWSVVPEWFQITRAELAACLQLTPDDPAALNGLGLLYLQMADASSDGGEQRMLATEAHRLLRHAVALRPTSAVLHYNLGEATSRMGDSAQTRSALLKAMALVEGNSTRALEELEFAPCAERLGAFRVEWERAGAQQVRDHDTGTAQLRDLLLQRVWAALGDLAVSCDQPERARDAFKAATAGPMPGPVWGKLGGVFEALGSPLDAIDCFRQALASEPFSLNIQLHLARLCLAHGQPDEAARWCRDALTVIETCPVYAPYHQPFADVLASASNPSGVPA